MHQTPDSEHIDPKGALDAAALPGLPKDSSSAPGAALTTEPGVVTLTLSMYRQHTRIIYCQDTRTAVVIDPASDPQLILDEAKKLNLTIESVWLTHSHPDHCGGVRGVTEATGATFLTHRDPHEWYLRWQVVRASKFFGMDVSTVRRCPRATRYIDEGDKLTVGNHEFDVLFTPGHSPGHLSFYCPKQRVLIAGDVIYKEAVGNTTNYGADEGQLRTSLAKIMSLPDDTKVLSGHGDDSTIGYIRANNRQLHALLGPPAPPQQPQHP